MKITFFGAGYVGLVTGIGFAEMDHDVCIVDVNKERIQQLNKGFCPIYEPGLSDLMQKNKERLTYTSDPAVALENVDIIFIAVGTPANEKGAASLDAIYTVAKTIAQYIEKECIVVIKSTVPVETGEKVEACISETLQKRNLSIKIPVVSNPEFLKEGSAIDDFMHPCRIIIGTDNESAIKKMEMLYQPFIEKDYPFLVMDRPSAELSKYVANAMLASRISFMNEMSHIAEKMNANIEHVKNAIGFDKRIGPLFLNAGCGYGGSCFPKDISALKMIAQELGLKPSMLDAIMDVNDRQKLTLYSKICDHFSSDLKHKTMAVWGLAFKPNTDDMREATSTVLLPALLEQGTYIKAYDPVASENAKKYFYSHKNLMICSSAEETLQDADALIIVTEWDEFKKFPIMTIKKSLKKPIIFDGRNIFKPDEMSSLGIHYFSIGRSSTVDTI